LVLSLAACSEDKKETSAPVRPVLWTTVVLQNPGATTFAGTIEPQLTANLGFQALGRIVSRDVNLGDIVVKGQKLAELDDVSADLALKIADSDLISARAQQTNALATAQRQESLLERKAVAESDVDTARQARDSADAAVLKAQANVDKAREQLGYTILTATFDGVVTDVSAEVGQTVSPGMVVLTIAEPNLRDAVVDVPDGLDEAFKPGAAFAVAMQANRTVSATGKVREVAPDADPTTRTRRIKIGLENPPVNMRLGTLITATLASTGSAAIYLPRSAILEKDGKVFATNHAWDEVAAIGRLTPPAAGWNYLEECAAAEQRGCVEAHDVQLGIERVLSGESEHFVKVYPCAFGGFHHWFQLSVSQAPADSGGTAIVVHTDITALQHDSLTGLANRQLIEPQLDLVIAEGARRKIVAGLMMIDLDLFKTVNDQSGHLAGDKVLIDVANRLRGCVRKTDLAARFGGDEFVVIFGPTAASSDVEAAAARIFAVLNVPYFLDGEALNVGASAGVALFPADSTTVEGLLEQADRAMYAAKRQGRGRLHKVDLIPVDNEPA